MKDGTKVKLSKSAQSIHTCPEGRENNKTARIVTHQTKYEGGVVKLDRDLHGWQYWNESDLVKIWE